MKPRIAALNISLDQFAVIFGNWGGGYLFVGAFYWAIYSRSRQKLEGGR